MTHLEHIRNKMAEKGADAFLATGERTLFYLTDFAFEDGCVLVLPDSAFLVTDFRYTEAAEKKAGDTFTVVAPQMQLAFLEETLQKNGISRLGVEETDLSYARYTRFASYFSAELVPFSDALTSLRAVKNEKEIRRTAEAQRLTDEAFSHILGYITKDRTETDIALELEFFMRKNGAERTSFDTIAVSGTQSAIPHGTPRHVPLECGFLTMDFGCVVDGYCSDMTRTVAIGRADAEMRRLYDTVLAAQAAALATVRAGISGKAVDKAARHIIEEAGYIGAFGHGTGHGVGLDIHESPRVSPSSSDVLHPGHIITVEPGIYLPGRYGCRIEDMVCVTEDGCRNFTQSPKDLIEIF